MGSDVSVNLPEGWVTGDMVAQMAYCPRRFHLMYVEGRWADNTHTVEGRSVHRRVDKIDQVLPSPHAATGKPKQSDEPSGDEPPVIVRSVPLASERLSLMAKLDLASCDPEGGEAMPVETKRGKVPDNAQKSYEPERVQLMAQGLLLREQGYKVTQGMIYFAGSRTRVTVPFTPELEARTLELIAAARVAQGASLLPEPLDDSPKCRGCSLNGICLPDETLALRLVPPDPVAPGVRRLYPAKDDALPLYVQEQGAKVGKKGETLTIEKSGEELGSVRLKDTSQVVLLGNVQISAQTLHLLCEAEVPVLHLSSGGWFSGITHGWGLRNAYDRAAQFTAFADPARCLEFSREVVRAKAVNQRALLMRNGVPAPENARAVADMADLIRKIPGADSADTLLGLEGSLAAPYFQNFSGMLKPKDFDAAAWEISSRNRRPPKDPVNALLSFAYALLSKECAVALLAEGLDPHWGFYHRPRHGRPALALDLMEPFRPVIAESAVLSCINTGMVVAADFERGAGACLLGSAGRKAFIRAYEARCEQLVTHPLFDYRISWRNAVRIQARLLSRRLRGDIAEWPCITVR